MPERTSLARDEHEGFRSPGWAPEPGAEDATAAPDHSSRIPDWQRAEERYRLLLTTLAERVWRFELTPALELRGEPRGLAAAMLRRARFVECNPPWAHESNTMDTHGSASLWLSDVLMGTYTEQLDLLERFVRSGFRIVDVRCTEWERSGRARTVLTNLVGMVERDRLQGLWGAQRPIRAEEPLERLPLRFSETLTDDVTLLDERGVILFESPSMEQRLGYMARGRTGQRVLDHVHPEEGEAVREAIASRLGTPGSTGAVLKLRARHSDGRWQWYAAVLRHLAAIPGPPLLALSLLDADTPPPPAGERPPRAARLKRRVARLNDALTSISGHAQLALDQCVPGSAVARELQQVLAGVERATGVVRELLTERVPGRTTRSARAASPS